MVSIRPSSSIWPSKRQFSLQREGEVGGGGWGGRGHTEKRLVSGQWGMGRWHQLCDPGKPINPLP